MAKKGEKHAQLKEWLQALPFSNVFYIGALGQDVMSCLVLTEGEKQKYGLEELVPDFIIPEQYYVVCQATAEHSEFNDTSDLSILRSKKKA